MQTEIVTFCCFILRKKIFENKNIIFLFQFLSFGMQLKSNRFKSTFVLFKNPNPNELIIEIFCLSKIPDQKVLEKALGENRKKQDSKNLLRKIYSSET